MVARSTVLIILFVVFYLIIQIVELCQFMSALLPNCTNIGETVYNDRYGTCYNIKLALFESGHMFALNFPLETLLR